MDDVKDEQLSKEERKKRKELRRAKREEFQTRLNAVPRNNTAQRNAIIIEIVTQHLKKDVDVFQARWQNGKALSNDVFSNTPLFWYKKHKWSHKDVKEFFKIVGIYKENLDSELSIIWGIDETAKNKKKEKKKKLREKHLRKESFASLLTLRHSSLRLMNERSQSFVKQHDPKSENASIEIWNLMVKSRGGSEQECPELNHDQFNIALMDNQIAVDPDMSVDLFYELIKTWEIIEKHREDKKNNPEQFNNAKRNKYKQSRMNLGATSGPMSMAAIGGSAALTALLLAKGDSQNAPDDDDDIPDTEELDVLHEDAAGDGVADAAVVARQSEHKEEIVPQKDKIKHIKKKKISRQFIKRMLRHINKNIKREHLIANPKKLKHSKLILVVFSKIFEAMQAQQAFDVQNDYISQALTPEQLNSPTALLEILETRDAEWKQRVQCLEYLESNIGTNANLRPLFEEDSFLSLIVGWTSQLYDERSRVTQTAAELFPSLLTVCLAEMETPALIFEEENKCLSIMLEGLFTMLKNKRAKALSDIAHDVLIETINILATVAQDLDPTAYHRIMNFLYNHTLYEHEKHERVRGGCISYGCFVVYGTQSQERINQSLTLSPNGGHLNPLTPSRSVSAERDHTPSASPLDLDGNSGGEHKQNGDRANGKEEKENENEKEKESKRIKIANKPQRNFLFSDETFMTMFGKLIGNGIDDRGKEPREKAMKVLKKIEADNREVLEKYVDAILLNKYEKWKRFNQPKGSKKGGKNTGRKRISPIKRTKTTPNKKLLAKQKESNIAKSMTDALNVPNGDNE